MLFTTEGFFEVGIESWPAWDLNPQPLNSIQTLELTELSGHEFNSHLEHLELTLYYICIYIYIYIYIYIDIMYIYSGNLKKSPLSILIHLRLVHLACSKQCFDKEIKSSYQVLRSSCKYASQFAACT